MSIFEDSLKQVCYDSEANLGWGGDKRIYLKSNKHFQISDFHKVGFTVRIHAVI